MKPSATIELRIIVGTNDMVRAWRRCLPANPTSEEADSAFRLAVHFLFKKGKVAIDRARLLDDVGAEFGVEKVRPVET